MRSWHAWGDGAMPGRPRYVHPPEISVGDSEPGDQLDGADRALTRSARRMGRMAGQTSPTCAVRCSESRSVWGVT